MKKKFLQAKQEGHDLLNIFEDDSSFIHFFNLMSSFTHQSINGLDHITTRYKNNIILTCLEMVTTNTKRKIRRLIIYAYHDCGLLVQEQKSHFQDSSGPEISRDFDNFAHSHSESEYTHECSTGSGTLQG